MNTQPSRHGETSSDLVGTEAAPGDRAISDVGRFSGRKRTRLESRAGSRPRFNGTAPAIVYGFAGAGKAAELAISHFPPCLTKVLM